MSYSLEVHGGLTNLVVCWKTLALHLHDAASWCTHTNRHKLQFVVTDVMVEYHIHVNVRVRVRVALAVSQDGC